MESSSINMLDRISGNIRALVDESERVFLDFAETYPAFVREMRRGLAQSAESLRKLGLGGSFDEAIRKTLNASKTVISDAVGRFSVMHKRDDALLGTLSRGIGTLSELEAASSRIKEDSESMELISLNAMTVAIKSGNSGKAFSVITEELKRLSTRTIELTDLLAADGAGLMGLFQRYQKNVEQLEDAQKALFQDLDQRLIAKFTGIEENVGVLGSRLNELVALSKGVEKPVLAIMERIQCQDLIRQSLDHIALALEELTRLGQESANEGRVFSLRLADLAGSILDDVKKTLDDATATLRKETASINNVVELGEKRRRELLGKMFGDKGGGETSAAFNSAAAALKGIEAQTEAYFRQKLMIVSDGERLSSAVESLGARFRAFAKILTRFKTIDIASRIEVAKVATLRSMGDTVEAMTELTERIGSDVDVSLSATKRFLQDTRQATAEYSRIADDEGVLIHESAEALREAYREIEALHLSLIKQVQAFGLFTSEFLGSIKLAERKTVALGRLSAIVDESIADFAALRASMERDESGVLIDENVDLPLSKRMKELIDRFTIYAHKKTAADLSGLSVEAGAELGEVTLF